MKTIQQWLESQKVDEAAKQELRGLTDTAELEDRFYRDLSFGTGGLRGKMSAGNNRMNRYTVAKATQGLASYLLENKGKPSVCIAYDTRNQSREFARTAASVLCANGVAVRLYDTVHPTPMLSFAVRHFQADAGIVITASHNPKEYNGYKVYGPDGGQITDSAAGKILSHIQACDIFDGVKELTWEEARRSGLLNLLDAAADEPYYEKVAALAMRRDLIAAKAPDLHILYTPLHGSGNIPVRRMLERLGFTKVDIVKEQELPDGNFPTAPYPNPEMPQVFEIAKKLAKETNPDLIFGTDPDCDRIGVLARNEKGGFEVLTGNQTGALLCDYILRTRRELQTLPQNAAVVKTIVTTDLAAAICEAYGAALCEVLTGFKYIGECAGQWEENGEHTFVFGFEESYGYLSGDFVRDKDAVIAACLIAEMALYYKDQQKTLYQALGELYERYGFYREKLITLEMPGKEGQEKIAQTLAKLRENYASLFGDKLPCRVEDYEQSVRLDCRTGAKEPITLPRSNVLKFYFEPQSWFVLRPSGTEPKMKIYLSVKGDSASDAAQRLDGFEAFVRGALMG